MRLKKLFYKNNHTGWTLKEVRFGSLTLLVGASGVGKTQTLKAISTLSRIAGGSSQNGIEWNLEFEEAGIDYVWSGKFDTSREVADFVGGERPEFQILEESLTDTTNNVELFSRDSQELKYHGIPTVKLDPNKSAIELLKEQSDIEPISKGFRRINWLKIDERVYMYMAVRIINSERKRTLSQIKAVPRQDPIVKLYLLKENVPDVFKKIEDRFIEIFPLVKSIDFDLRELGEEMIRPVLKIREKDVESWIKYPDISAGMYRTLCQIIMLTLAEDGDVILIDEFENGLGINCIDDLADMASDPDVNIQIIMTSHHPYIINNIPFNNWRVVTRRGSDVSVSTSDELRIGKQSKHDAFMQLIQTSAYRTGQS